MIGFTGFVWTEDLDVGLTESWGESKGEVDSQFSSCYYDGGRDQCTSRGLQVASKKNTNKQTMKRRYGAWEPG